MNEEKARKIKSTIEHGHLACLLCEANGYIKCLEKASGLEEAATTASKRLKTFKTDESDVWEALDKELAKWDAEK